MALDLPAGAREAIDRWRREVFAGREELRLPAAETLHVTLVFLGYLPEKAIPRIGELLGSPGAAPRLTPGAVRPLPPRRPRLYALDLEDEGGRASALQARLAGALERERLYRPETRPFWPHITLARVKRNRPAPALGDPAPPPDEAFEAAEVVLYRSHLGPAGARYEPLVRVPF